MAAGLRGAHGGDRGNEFAEAVAAIGAEPRQWRRRKVICCLLGRDAHHRPPVGVERHGADDGQACRGGALDGSLGFLDGGHRLDPDHVRTARGESQGLFTEGPDRILVCEVADGPHDVAGRAHGPRDQDVALRPVGHRPGQHRGFPVEFADPVRGGVQFQPVRGSTEAVGEDDIGAGHDHGLMIGLDSFRIVDVQKFRRTSGLESGSEEIGAGGAVSDEHAPCLEKAPESFGVRHCVEVQGSGTPADLCDCVARPRCRARTAQAKAA